MKKIPIWLVFILIFAALIAIKFIFFAKKVDEKKAKGGNDKPIAVNYAIATLSSESNALYTTGKVGALNEIVLNSEIAGYEINILWAWSRGKRA